MQCVTPMFYRYKIGEKKKGKIVPRSEVLTTLTKNPIYIRQMLSIKNKMSTEYKYIQVPCQHCYACQLKYSAEWATRIMLEAKKYENNYFITLTYDDEHVPIAEKTEWDQYETNPKDPFGDKIKTHQVRHNDGTWPYTLNPEDMDTFLNTLRKHLREKAKKRNMNYEGLKYFYCGEYGTETERPHYHIILLNCPLDPEEFYDPHIDKNWKAHFKSKELDHIWATGDKHNRKPKGMIDIAELEWSAAAYVARYCTKKLNMNDKTYYLDGGRLPEFIRMSKGIGFDYFEKNYQEIYDNDTIIMRTIRGNLGTVKPPKAFDRKLEKIDPKLYEKIKTSREHAKERADHIIQEITDATDAQRLQQEAESLSKKMQMLPRAGDL